jgi:hypothetical protein
MGYSRAAERPIQLVGGLVSLFVARFQGVHGKVPVLDCLSGDLVDMLADGQKSQRNGEFANDQAD